MKRVCYNETHMQHNIYKEELLEHYHFPQNFGVLDSYNTTSKQLNPFCGDEIEMYLQLKNSKVVDISFRGKGCAISIASASILTEFVKEKAVVTLTKMDEDDMLDLINIDVSETRKKCLLLSLAVLKDCLT